MRPISPKLRNLIAENPFMAQCAVPGCNSKPEWEHAFIYAGKQINEEWAIVPICKYHHREGGLNKDFNRWVAINRVNINFASMMFPKFNWEQLKLKLDSMFSQVFDIERILLIDNCKNPLYT